MSQKRIFVAGHNGMVGSAICRRLKRESNLNIITRSRAELDLCDQHAVRKFFNENKPHQVYVAAARVGGIHANNIYPAEFIYQNMQINNNLIHSAWEYGVEKLLYLGSSCIYPRETVQPIQEKQLLTGKLEPTNEPYAVAKIAGIKMCESYNRQYGTDFRCLMPTNLYGPNDNYDLQTSHVLPALIRKFHNAKTNDDEYAEIWGTGSPTREFLHCDDLADACAFVMGLEHSVINAITDSRESHINVGTGIETSILEVAKLVAHVVGFKGKLRCDSSKPDGTPRKVMDNSLLFAQGWKPKLSLEEGIRDSYKYFLDNVVCR